MTITEALAEIRTITKRIEKKQQFVEQNVGLHRQIRDPYEDEGGIKAKVANELQSIRDLEERIVELRGLILSANIDNELTVDGKTRSIQQWLTWRREVGNTQGRWWSRLVTGVNNAVTRARSEALKSQQPAGEQDFVVAVDVADAAKRAEHVEVVLGQLDGKLSLANATIEVQ